MNSKWTTGELLAGKTIQVIATTVVVWFVITKLISWLCMVLFHWGGFNLVLIGIIGIASFLISLKGLKTYFNKGLSADEEPERVRDDSSVSQGASEKDTKFKWHCTYSLASGYVVLIITALIGRGIGSSLWDRADAITEINGQYISTIILGAVIMGFVPYIIAFIFTKYFHRFMLKVTETNKVLLEDFMNGCYINEIPEKFRGSRSINGIIKTLKNGEAFTVRSAVSVYQTKQVVFKICKSIAFVGGIIVAILTALSFGAFNIVESELSDNIRGVGKGFPDSRTRETVGNTRQAKNDAKQQAYYDNQQAKKKAVFDENQARKAEAYNSNSNDAQSKRNFANNSRDKYNKM